MATVSVTASVDSALRRAFSEASVRLMPTAMMSSIIAALKGLGIEVETIDNVLCLSQGATQMNTSLALRNFAKRAEYAEFFVQENGHPKTWSQEKKIAYLRDHTDEQYRALFQAPVLEAGVRTLDPNMSKKAYLQLTTQEKMQFVREFGETGVRQVFSK
jgi:hypothetical protein